MNILLNKNVLIVRYSNVVAPFSLVACLVFYLLCRGHHRTPQDEEECGENCGVELNEEPANTEAYSSGCNNL